MALGNFISLTQLGVIFTPVFRNNMASTQAEPGLADCSRANRGRESRMVLANHWKGYTIYRNMGGKTNNSWNKKKTQFFVSTAILQDVTF